MSAAEGETDEEEGVLVIEAPTPTPPPPPTPTATPEPTPPPLPTYSVEQMKKKKGYVNADGVNLRSGPDTAYEVVEVLDAHTVVTLTGKSGDWYQATCEKGDGFLSAEFVMMGAVPTPTPTPRPYTVTKLDRVTGYITSKDVNFRAGPHKSYEVLVQAERYDTLSITGESEDWYRVRYKSKTGYIAKRYVRVGISPKEYESAGKYSSADVLLMAQIAYRESARGNTEGYKAVASVVLNRVRSSKWPSTIEKVIFQGKGAQFSPAENENRLRLTKPSKACVAAVCDVMANGSILPSEVMYFRTARKGTSWASSRTYYATYGGNCYFS